MRLWSQRSLKVFVFNWESRYFSDVGKKGHMITCQTLSGVFVRCCQEWSRNDILWKKRWWVGKVWGTWEKRQRGRSLFTLRTGCKKAIHISNHFHWSVQPFLQSSFIFQQSYFSFIHAQLCSVYAFYSTNWGAVTKNIVRPEAELTFSGQWILTTVNFKVFFYFSLF